MSKHEHDPKAARPSQPSDLEKILKLNFGRESRAREGPGAAMEALVQTNPKVYSRPEEWDEVLEVLRESFLEVPPGLDRLAGQPLPALGNDGVGARVIPMGWKARKAPSANRSRWVSQLRWATAAVACLFLGWLAWTVLPELGRRGKAQVIAFSAEVRGAALAGTELVRKSETRARLSTGAAWFVVQKHGKGFSVETPYGDVRVTGTSFGVRVESGKLEVEVTEGSVDVSQSGNLESIKPGERISASALGLGKAEPRPEGINPPVWALDAFKPQTGTYLPSMNPVSGSALPQPQVPQSPPNPASGNAPTQP